MPTLGNSPSWTNYAFYEVNVDNQVASGSTTMPTAGQAGGLITSISFYAMSEPGFSPTNFVGCVWNAPGGTLVGGATTANISVGAGTNSVGGQQWNTGSCTPTYVAGGNNIYIGWTRDNSSGHSMLFSYNSTGGGFTAKGSSPGSLGSHTGIGQVGSYVTYAVIQLPTATSQAATSVTSTTATLNGNFADGGFADGGYTGQNGNCSWTLYYSGTSNTGPWTVGATGSPTTLGDSLNESVGLTGLTASHTYYCYATCTTPAGTSNGSVLSFVTNGVPNAPTLNTPTNGAAANLVASGETFTWTYNSGGAGGGQTQWALEFTSSGMNGGSTQWWNTTTVGWSTSSHYNVSSATTVTIGASNFTGSAGTTCTWTVSDVDSGGTSPYASTFNLVSEAAPSAPTLLTAANNSYTDFTTNTTPTFTWTYNPTNAVGGQTNFMFRQKISGGAYSYWNGTAFQGSEPGSWPALTVKTYTFPTGQWANGAAGIAQVYNWSVNTQDDGGKGPYASDFTLTGQAAPTVSVTAPSGNTNVTKPTVQWTSTIPAGASQTQYQVRTFTAAQYGAIGFNPATSNATDDSGVVTSAATSYQIGTVLVPGTTYRAYTQLTETGGQVTGF